MDKIQKIINDFKKLSNKLKKQSKNGSLILIDLASSTEYKTCNGKDRWLSRLIAFYETVKSILSEQNLKFLGDGILGFFDYSVLPPNVLLEKANNILSNIIKLNNDKSFIGTHELKIRIILNCGEVFLFQEQDPQGAAVDKLFRLEKFVPNSHIGMTEEFVSKAKLDNNKLETKPVGYFFLKGLAVGKHPLYLYDPDVHSSAVNDLITKSIAAELWWLPGTTTLPEFCCVIPFRVNETTEIAELPSFNKQIEFIYPV